MTFRMLLAITIAALASAVVLVGRPQESRGLQAVTVGFDVDPKASPANGAASLGSIEACTSVKNAAGSQFKIDVFFDGLPSGQDMAGFNYKINFDQTRLKIVGQNHALLLTSAADSSPFKLGDDVPNAQSPHNVAQADFGTPETGPMTGVLGRYTLEIKGNAPDGVAELSLSDVGVFNSLGEDIPIDQIASGSIALGTACPSDLPPPTSPPKPNPTPPPQPEVTPPPEETPLTAVLDADEDRVPDADDQCPDSASGAGVDASGCSDSQLKSLTQQVKTQLLESLAAGLNVDVSLDAVAVGGSTAVLAAFADENDEPVSGTDITFKIEEQPGSDADLNGKAKVTKTSNAAGVAKATLNPGSTPGEIVVSATAEGQTETVTVTVGEGAAAAPTPGTTPGGEPSPGEGTAPAGESSPVAGTQAGEEEDDGGGAGAWPYAVGGIGLAALTVSAGLWWWRRRAAGGP